MIDPDREFGCADGSCPFSSRHGMHTNGGCRCTYEAFHDPEQRRTVDAMLAKARAVATRDAEIASLRAEVARLAASTKYARIVAIVREWGGGGHGLPSRLRNNGDYTTAALVEALRGVIGGSDA